MSQTRVAPPPSWVRFALPLFLTKSCREPFLGDLIEEYDDLTRSGAAIVSPHLWYLKQLMFVLSTGRLSVWLAAAVIASILVTNVLFPLLAIRLPETQVINIICFGGAGVVWTIAGFIACSQSEEMMDGIYSGSGIAFTSMTAAMVTFALVHISLSMRPFAFLPAFTLIGAGCGSVGSIVAKAGLALSRS